ncbi:MAG: hypothetical protein HUU54_09355 [Ignavibacteriaceae bacterium]|nr:hypothetical protein [Ignavibacteriaceae bacterium]
MIGLRISKYVKKAAKDRGFDQLMSLFTQLLLITSGNVPEALNWLNEIDRKYQLTSTEYGIGNFIEDLKKRNFLTEDPVSGNLNITSKTELHLRKESLEEIFGKLRKTSRGDHSSFISGNGDEITSDIRDFRFGDSPEQIDFTYSIRNSQINHGLDDFHLTENDLTIREKDHRSITSTVLMIDISHSMILYGEDRITPAKKVALALTELIHMKFPKDKLDIIVFGDDAWPIEIKDLPYLSVGPYHTNTVAGLELAMDLLRRRKTKNRQIFMITDGKPTCIKEGIKYYKNSFGLDRKIINKTLDQAAVCRKRGITITTFMIAKDPYLQRFVREFTAVNNGKAFYSTLNGLGQFIFEDYIKNKKRRIR